MSGIALDIDPQYADVQMFDSPSVSGSCSAHWLKPKDGMGRDRYAMTWIVAVSAGAGGGGGKSGASGTARGGGGGGGSGATSILCIPTLFLPDVIYILLGAGGAGGAADGDGGTGGPTYLTFNPPGNIGSANSLLLAANSLAQPGTKGLVGAAGGGGSGATATSDANNSVALWGLSKYTAGQGGKAGGVHTGAVGTNATFAASVGCCMGGAGGAGVGADDIDRAGGVVTAVAGDRLSEIANTTAPAAGTVAGGGGFFALPPFYPLWSFPGLGGSSSGLAAGGDGGRGGPGSGGGGGGGGTTGGVGGPGGNGRVIVISFANLPPFGQGIR